MTLHGRGVFGVISLRNFPLAIFIGMAFAALAAGNAVLAKPAEQTPLTEVAMVRVLHEAGVPDNVLHLMPGSGEIIGAALTGNAKIVGIAFTGSIETAHIINRTLAAGNGRVPVPIAETGGQNALIADSSVLGEQAIEDTIDSAFNSAGQRCFALRALFIQEDVADKTIWILKGAMGGTGDRRLIGGGPGARSFRPYPARHPLRPQRFGCCMLLVEQINDTGYGLTLEVHSRIEATIDRVVSCARVGNI